MSREPEQLEEGQDAAGLQHAAEHERPHKAPSVMLYLAVLFAAAFLLMAWSYFMQQRESIQTIEGLKQSVSAMESVDSLQAENTGLEAEVDALAAQVEGLRQELSAARESLARAEADRDRALEDRAALQALNQLRALYNQRRYRDARALLEQWEEGALESALSRISQALTPEEREIYDPLEAYHTIVDTL